MTTQDDISLIKLLRDEGYTIRAIAKETDIPATTVHRILSQRADPEGIDLLRARVEKLELLVKSLLPCAAKPFNSFTKENIAEML